MKDAHVVIFFFLLPSAEAKSIEKIGTVQCRAGFPTGFSGFRTNIQTISRVGLTCSGSTDS